MKMVQKKNEVNNIPNITNGDTNGDIHVDEGGDDWQVNMNTKNLLFSYVPVALVLKFRLKIPVVAAYR